MSELTITQTRSAIGEKAGARNTLKALGLRRPGARVTQTDTPQLRGMLRRVAHLVTVNGRARSGSAATSETTSLERVSSAKPRDRAGR